MLNNCPLCWGITVLWLAVICIVGSCDCDNLLFQWCSRDCSAFIGKCNIAGYRLQDMLSRCGHFLLVDLVRYSCAPIRGLNTSAVHRVLTWKRRAFEPYHDFCMTCGCIISLTSSPWVPFHVFFPSPGRLGPARAEVGLGFAVLGWFRRFRPPPPPLVWFRVRRHPLFFSLVFSGFCPLWARCVVLVFALSLFSCVLLFASWLSKLSFHFHFHLTFIVISSAPLLRGVCVYHLYRCKTSY